MGVESMGPWIIPCNPTHGDGHASFYEDNHRDYDLPYFSFKLHPFYCVVTYYHLLRNVVLFFEQLYQGRSLY